MGHLEPASRSFDTAMPDRVLDVQDLRIYFRFDSKVIRAVDGLSFHVDRGETLGIVGESGCGKSITALSLLRLVPAPAGRIESGSILLEGEDLIEMSTSRLRRVRGGRIAMIFQEPMSSLNPVLTIGRQITETLILHGDYSRKAARDRAAELLALVGISEPLERLDQYPHELSGGMRQRVMIAIALSCNPAVLVADEPTTALDVTVQAQIIDLILDLKEKLGTSVVLITHDLGVVAQMADRVAVMYAGRKVEEAPASAVLANPRHPYTRGLLNAVPNLALGEKAGHATARLQEIPGSVPSMLAPPPGCTFAPRCAHATAICKTTYPPLEPAADGHVVACWNHRAIGVYA